MCVIKTYSSEQCENNLVPLKTNATDFMRQFVIVVKACLSLRSWSETLMKTLDRGQLSARESSMKKDLI